MKKLELIKETTTSDGIWYHVQYDNKVIYVSRIEEEAKSYYDKHVPIEYGKEVLESKEQ